MHEQALHLLERWSACRPGLACWTSAAAAYGRALQVCIVASWYELTELPNVWQAACPVVSWHLTAAASIHHLRQVLPQGLSGAQLLTIVSTW